MPVLLSSIALFGKVFHYTELGMVSTLTMHRLVQAVLRDTIPAERQHQWMECAVYAVDATYPEGQDIAHWSDLERLLPHALTCTTWIEQAQFAMPEASRLLSRTGSYLNDRGRYGEAEPLLQRTLAIYRQKLGDSDPNDEPE